MSRNPLGYLFAKNDPIQDKHPDDGDKKADCIVQLWCANIIYIVPYVTRHCDIRIVFKGAVTDFDVRSDAKCEFEDQPASGPLFSGYWMQKEWKGDAKLCQCIKDAAAHFNSHHFKYCFWPTKPCRETDPKKQENCQCNSNYAAHCLINKCGLTFDGWGITGIPLGWDFHRTVCLQSHIETPGPSYAQCLCVCDQCFIKDAPVCGKFDSPEFKDCHILEGPMR